MKKTLFVTGATGFIGGRIVERLYDSRKYKVIAGVHNWSNAARIGRFPVEMRYCDVLDKNNLASSFKGITHVIHCAAGSERIITEGTRNILKVACDFKIKKLIYLSSIAVYGDTSGIVDESVIPRPIDSYGKAKLLAEKECLRYTIKNLPVVILRPTIVYGPFSQKWTVDIARLIACHIIGISHIFEGKCNFIYVDDLVNAITLALEVNDSISQVFNVGGSQVISWNNYFKEFNKQMGFADISVIRDEVYMKIKIKSLFYYPIKIIAKMLLSKYDHMARYYYRRFLLARKLMNNIENELKLNLNPSDLELFERSANYESKKIARMLGYKPIYPISDGLRLTAEWLKGIEMI